MSLFENEETVQFYKSKQEFLKGFEILQKQTQSKTAEIVREERKEITRIIKEFDYKNYFSRYQIDCDSVLAALVGASKANKELIRNGMSRKL